MKEKTFDKEQFKKVLIPFGISIVFYFALYIVYGVSFFSDSEGYLNMDSTREPVYSLFLAFTGLFGPVLRADIAVILQNIFMTVAVTYISVTIKNLFELKDIFVYFVMGLNFVVALAGQFLSLNGCVYSNSILTEGIALQMFLIFFGLMLKAVYEGGKKYEIYIAILGAIMMDTRKHMAIVYLITLIVLFFARIGKSGFFRKMITSVFIVICSVAVAVGGNYIYNFFVRGELVKNTRDMNLIITTSLYVSDREDAALITDEDARMIFVKVYDKLAEKEATIDYAEGGFLKLADHYSSSFDVITIDTTLPMLEDDAVARGFAPGLESEMEADRISKVILSSIFFDNIGKYMKVYGASIYNGLVNTVAKRNSLLDIYAAVAYICYIILMFILLLNKKDSEMRKVGFFGLTVLVSIGVNVLVTAALIFCQPRYMMYNMALFYAAGGIMLYTIINDNLSKKNFSETTNNKSEE